MGFKGGPSSVSRNMEMLVEPIKIVITGVVSSVPAV